MFCLCGQYTGQDAQRKKVKVILSCTKVWLLLSGPPSFKGGFYLLWINFLSSPCFTAALSTTQVRNTSMGSIVVFFTRPEVK